MKNRNQFHPYFMFSLAAILILACNQITRIGASPTAQIPPATIEVTKTPQPLDPTVGSSGLGDSLYPGFGNGGYDVQHYTLNITVNNISKSDLTAVTTIEAKATQDLSMFNLDFIGFDISAIKINDEPAEFKRVGRELTITPSTQLGKDRSFTVEVDYSGTPNEMISESLSVQTGWVTFDGGIYVLSEPDGSASFYPVNDHPLDKASYTFRVTVPKPFEVAANGLLTDQTDNGNTTTYVFEAKEPMASYLATINVDEFDEESDESESGIPIRNYYSTGLPDEVRQPFARQDEMIDYYSEAFGPYPFEVYGALVMDTYFGAALENQTMSIFGIDMIDTTDEERTEMVVAHELAHQWFGDSVSVADWSDIWLNEGFATYAEGLWIEHTQGRAMMDGWARYLYDDIIQNRQYITPPGKPPADDLFNAGVYEWGGLALHALRREVGDETFFKILKTYCARYAGGNATTDDFIAVSEEVSGEDLKKFFTDWLYSETLPPMPQ